MNEETELTDEEYMGALDYWLASGQQLQPHDWICVPRVRTLYDYWERSDAPYRPITHKKVIVHSLLAWAAQCVGRTIKYAREETSKRVKADERARRLEACLRDVLPVLTNVPYSDRLVARIRSEIPC